MPRLQVQILVGVILVIISSLVLIGYGLQEQNRMEVEAQGHLAEGIEDGAQLFWDNCRGCHGPQGQGIEGLAPPLNDRYFFTERMKEVGWSGTFEDYIISTISAGRLVSTRPQFVGGIKPAMPAWSEKFGGPLRDDQIRTLAQYIMNWETTALGEEVIEIFATPTPVAVDPVGRGRLVYDQNGCGACHAIEGISAGAVGPELTEIGSVAETRISGYTAEEYIRESILQPNAYVVEGYLEGVMPQNFGENLGDMELDDLAAFLLAQK